jgi:hypothetical protein
MTRNPNFIGPDPPGGFNSETSQEHPNELNSQQSSTWSKNATCESELKPQHAKPISLFSQRLAARKGTNSSNNDPFKRLPSSERDSVVVSLNITERNVSESPSTNAFNIPLSGFPSVTCQNDGVRQIETPTCKSLSLNQFLDSLKPKEEMKEEDLAIHRASVEFLQSMDYAKLQAAQLEIDQSVSESMMSYLQKRAVNKYGLVSKTTNITGPVPHSTPSIPVDLQRKEHMQACSTCDLHRTICSNDEEINQPSTSDESSQRNPFDPLLLASSMPGNRYMFNVNGEYIGERLSGIGGDPRLHESNGYTLPEIFRFSRSKVPAQRIASAHCLSLIVARLAGEKYPVKVHNSLMNMMHELHGFIHLRNLADDNHLSVREEALRGIWYLLGGSYVDEGTEYADSIDQIDIWCDASHLIVSEIVYQVEDEEATINDHARLFQISVSEALIAVAFVDRLQYLIVTSASNSSELIILLKVMYLLCSQSSAACMLSVNESKVIQKLLGLLECPWPDVVVSNQTVVLLVWKILFRLLQSSHETYARYSSEIKPLLLKYISIPPSFSEESVKVFRWTLRMISLIYCYGYEVYTSEVFGLLLQSPGASKFPEVYFAARQALVHFENMHDPVRFAMEWAKEIVSLHLGSKICQFGSSTDFNDIILIIQALELAAINESKWALSLDINEAIGHLCKTTLELCSNTVTTRNSFTQIQYFPNRTFRETLPSSNLTAMFRILSTLFEISIKLDKQIDLQRTRRFFSGILNMLPCNYWPSVSTCASRWLQCTDFTHPTDHVIAFMCITYIPVPFEQNLQELSFNLLNLGLRENNPWKLLGNILQFEVPCRKSFTVSVECLNNTWPSVIVPPNWVMKSLNSNFSETATFVTFILNMYAETFENSLSTLNRFLPLFFSLSELAPFFLRSDAPYLNDGAQQDLDTITYRLGIYGFRNQNSLESFLSELLDSYENFSYFSPVFQAYLTRSVCGTSTEACVLLLTLADKMGLLHSFTWNGEVLLSDSVQPLSLKTGLDPKILGSLPESGFWSQILRK